MYGVYSPPLPSGAPPLGSERPGSTLFSLHSPDPPRSCADARGGAVWRGGQPCDEIGESAHLHAVRASQSDSDTQNTTRSRTSHDRTTRQVAELESDQLAQTGHVMPGRACLGWLKWYCVRRSQIVTKALPGGNTSWRMRTSVLDRATGSAWCRLAPPFQKRKVPRCSQSQVRCVFRARSRGPECANLG